MKANKKVVLSTAVVLGVAALAAGGTIAYFTDKDSKENNFTVGNVDITLLESQLHRENSGRAATFPALTSDANYCDWNANPETYYGNPALIAGSYENARYCTPETAENLYSNSSSDISALGKSQTNTIRQWGFTDQAIINDAETYKNSVEDGDNSDGYFTVASKNILPGEWVRKFSYVTNEDTSSDAYVLIRYMVPANYADYIEVKIPGTPYEEDADSSTEGVQPYFYAVTYTDTDNDGELDTYVAYDAVSAADGIDSYAGYTQTIDNVAYKVYAAVTRKALVSGEMTFWSPVNTVRIAKDTDQATLKALLTDNIIDVNVDAQAIQSATFSDAIEAINEL